MSFVACAYENHLAKKNFCNARGRYKEIWPTQQPIKLFVLSMPCNQNKSETCQEPVQYHKITIQVAWNIAKGNIHATNQK